MTGKGSPTELYLHILNSVYLNEKANNSLCLNEKVYKTHFQLWHLKIHKQETLQDHTMIIIVLAMILIFDPDIMKHKKGKKRGKY
jgi:hypothetical protein